jgi:hypothetical protein
VLTDEERQQIEQAIAEAMLMDMSHYDGELAFSDGFFSGVSWVRRLIEKQTGTRLTVMHLLASTEE